MTLPHPFGHAQRPRAVALAAAVATFAATLSLPATAHASAHSAPGAAGSTITAVAVEERDWDFDGVIDEIVETTTVLDRSGRLLESRELNSTPDGAVSFYNTVEYHYDARGRFTLSVFEAGDASGPTLVQYVEQSYDSAGATSEVRVSTDYGADGTIDTSETTVSSQTRLTASASTEVDRDGDGAVDALFVLAQELDRRGNVVLVTAAFDEGADGSIDSSTETTSSYSARGSLVSTTTTWASAGETGGSSTTEFQYSPRGLVTGWSTIDEPSGAAVVGAVTYDASGRPTLVVEQRDSDADGVVDEVATQRSRYDARGLLLEETFRSEFPLFPEFGYEQAWRFEHDARGRVVTATSSLDFGLDGVIEISSTSFTVLDAQGRVLEQRMEDDENGDGMPDRITVDRYTYDASGSVLTRVTEVDVDGDGIVESTTSYTRTVS